jgi:hypothetical protein
VKNNAVTQSKTKIAGIILALAVGAGLIPAQTSEPTRDLIGWATNGTTVLQTYRITSIITNVIPARPLPPHLATNRPPPEPRLHTREWSYTNHVFHSFLPGTLPNLIWTNFLAHTNGRTMRIWEERSHPPDWMTNGPVVRWNTNSLLWGMRGMTALSPAWAGQGHYGQVPLTALTRRHVYTRGHGMGPEGFNVHKPGRKGWFFTAANRKIEVTIIRSVVRASAGPNQQRLDYTIMLLDRDLPPEIETMAVAAPEQVFKLIARPPNAIVPMPIFQTEQGGNVSSSVAPLTVNTWKGGDSGSPNLLPLPGELVFFSGRSTTGPGPEMQADMDELCRLEKLNPAKYQLRWVDLEKLTAAAASGD